MKNLNNLFASLVVLIILMPTIVFGATMKVGDEVSFRKGNNIHDNLYIAGGNISVNSIIFGDLLIAGGNILVSENISEDIFIAGGAVTILGDTSGDVRVVGGNILIAGDIRGELVVVGGSVTISSDVSIGKDVVVAGGQVFIDGNVDGDVKIAGGVVTIRGNIKGNVKAEIDESLVIGEGAVISGGLDYGASSSGTLKVEEGGVVLGEIVFREIKPIESGINNLMFTFVAILGIFVIFKLVTLIIVSLVLVWLFRNFSESITRRALQNSLQMFGIGFVTLVIIPIASIILFVTLFGIPFGLMAMFFYGFLLIMTCVYSGIVVGVRTGQLIKKSNKIIITWKNIIGGTLLLTIIKFVPFIGWMVGLVIFLITLGSIVDVVINKMWRNR